MVSAFREGCRFMLTPPPTPPRLSRVTVRKAVRLEGRGTGGAVESGLVDSTQAFHARISLRARFVRWLKVRAPTSFIAAVFSLATHPADAQEETKDKHLTDPCSATVHL